MNKYTEKYRRIIDKLIDESFPSLKGKKIYLSYFSRKKYSGGVFWALPFLRLLFINKERKFNDKQLIGLLVHELCHLERSQKTGWFKTSFMGLFYWVSSKYRKKEEEEAEKLTIEKGYAKEYYALVKKFHKFRLKSSKYYLSPEEFKSYAMKIKKW